MKKLLWIGLAIVLVGWILYSNIHQQDIQADGKRTIYAVIPLSGQFAEYGKDVQNTMELYVKKQNVPFKIKYVDSEGSPSKAITAFQQASINDKNPIVISSFAMISSALAPIVEQKNGFLFAISTVTISTNSHSFQRMSRGAEDIMQVVAPFIEKNYKKVSIVYTQDDYGLKEFNYLKNEFEKTGVKIVSDVPLAMTQTDVRNEVVKLKSEDTDAVIVLGMTTQGYINIFRELHQQGYKGQVIADSGLTNPPVFRGVGENAEGVILSAMTAETEMPQPDKVEQLKKELKPNNIPLYFIVLETVDTLDLIKYFINNNIPFIQKSFKDLAKWDGVGGLMTFTGNGDAHAFSYVMAQVKDGKIIPVESETK